MRVSQSASHWQQALVRKTGLLIAAICLSPALTLAAEFSSKIDEQPTASGALGGGIQTDYVVQVLLSLLLVIGVIVLLSFLVKRIGIQTRAGSGAVRILSVVSLGAKDRLLLVAVGEEQLLLGSSPGSVQKLHTLDKPIDLASGLDAVTDERSFMSVLSSVRRGQQS